MSVLSRGLGLIRKIIFHCQFSVPLLVLFSFLQCKCFYRYFCDLCVCERERETHIPYRLTEICFLLISPFMHEYFGTLLCWGYVKVNTEKWMGLPKTACHSK